MNKVQGQVHTQSNAKRRALLRVKGQKHASRPHARKLSSDQSTLRALGYCVQLASSEKNSTSWHRADEEKHAPNDLRDVVKLKGN